MVIIRIMDAGVLSDVQVPLRGKLHRGVAIAGRTRRNGGIRAPETVAVGRGAAVCTYQPIRKQPHAKELLLWTKCVLVF